MKPEAGMVKRIKLANYQVDELNKKKTQITKIRN